LAFFLIFYFIQNRKTIKPNTCVEEKAPKSLGELLQFRWFVQVSPEFKPFFYVIDIVFCLSCQVLQVKEKKLTKLRKQAASLKVKMSYKIN